MTLSTHAVPCLSSLGPVQPVIRTLYLVGRKAVPAFPFYIPGNVKALQATVRKRNKVLLQGIDTKGMRYFKFGGRAVRSFRFNIEFVVTAVKFAGNGVVRVCVKDIVKIAKYSLLTHFLHGQIMMGALPFFIGCFVAVLTFFTANEDCFFFRWQRLAVVPGKVEERCGKNNQSSQQCCKFPTRKSRLCR